MAPLTVIEYFDVFKYSYLGHIPPDFVVHCDRGSSKAAGGEDLQVEEPV
jgi:hypothetical protein